MSSEEHLINYVCMYACMYKCVCMHVCVYDCMYDGYQNSNCITQIFIKSDYKCMSVIGGAMSYTTPIPSIQIYRK